MSAAADAPGAPASVPAATLAHQLGEAVALLDGYVAVLSGSAGLAPPERHAVEMIALATARLRRCTQDLIELAAAGRERPDDAPADAGRALADAVEAVRRGADGRRLTVEAGPLPAVTVGRHELTVLFAHLLRGAAASGEAGTAPAVQVSAEHARGGDVVITVADDAPAPPGAERLFEPGARARGRGPLLGAGAGAEICRRIVEGAGGRIESRPRAPRGLEVQITLRGGEG